MEKREGKYEENINVYQMFLNTLMSFGLSNSEAIDVANVIVQKKEGKKNYLKNMNNNFIQKIVRKTRSKELEKILR